MHEHVMGVAYVRLSPYAAVYFKSLLHSTQTDTHRKCSTPANLEENSVNYNLNEGWVFATHLGSKIWWHTTAPHRVQQLLFRASVWKVVWLPTY